MLETVWHQLSGHADKPGISGMLLTCADGRCERLGEVRLDGLQEPVMKAERDTIWLGFRHEDVWTEDASPHVAEMAFEPLDMAPMDVLEMPLRELLDWWLSCYQYYLISGDQTSPRPVSTSPRD
ncbi:hypothetical protein FALCPG4_005212 [Fusarium falciforme]